MLPQRTHNTSVQIDAELRVFFVEVRLARRGVGLCCALQCMWSRSTTVEELLLCNAVNINLWHANMFDISFGTQLHRTADVRFVHSCKTVMGWPWLNPDLKSAATMPVILCNEFMSIPDVLCHAGDWCPYMHANVSIETHTPERAWQCTFCSHSRSRFTLDMHRTCNTHNQSF